MEIPSLKRLEQNLSAEDKEKVIAIVKTKAFDLIAQHFMEARGSVNLPRARFLAIMSAVSQEQWMSMKDDFEHKEKQKKEDSIGAP